MRAREGMQTAIVLFVFTFLWVGNSACDIQSVPSLFPLFPALLTSQWEMFFVIGLFRAVTEGVTVSNYFSKNLSKLKRFP